MTGLVVAAGASPIASASRIVKADYGDADRLGRIAKPDYTGKGRFDRPMKVAFRINSAKGRDRVRFEARKVSFLCSDNSFQVRRDLTPIRTRLDHHKTFEQVIYSNISGESVYWLRGKLTHHGRRAKGFILALTNPPQEQEAEGVPECTTSGKRFWVAKRVK